MLTRNRRSLVGLAVAAAAVLLAAASPKRAAAPGVAAPVAAPAAPPTAWIEQPSAAIAPGSAAVAAHARRTKDPLLTPDLIRTFQLLLSEAYAKDKVGMLAEMRARIAQQLPPEQHERALALLGRYIDYAQALGTLTPPDPNDPAALSRMLDARAAIRQRLFGADEVEGLFGSEEAFDRFNVAKLAVEHDPTLGAEQRRAAIAQLESTWLTPEERRDRSEALVHVDVAAQTAALDARGASPAERLDERTRAYGGEAAQRLATLDAQEQDWQGRLARYAALDPAARSQVRGQWFTAQEAQRLDGALALRAITAKKQGNAAP